MRNINMLLSSCLAALLAVAPVTVTAQANPSVSGPVTAAVADAAQPAGKININSADALTLQKELAGIGLNKANAIVAYREANGNFTAIDELIEVNGIGKALLDRNRDKLAIE